MLRAFETVDRRSVISIVFYESHCIREEEAMLKTFAVAVLAIAMPVGSTHAAATFSLGMKGHKRTIPGCTVGQQAAATCACGTAANGRPLLCQKGQWCHYPIAKVCTQ